MPLTASRSSRPRWTATQNVVAGNEIGTATGGGYLFGNMDPGNRGNGVEIQDAANNVIGGTSAGQGT